MELSKKLSVLADAAKYDVSCSSSGSQRSSQKAGGLGNTTGMGICHSYTPDGRCVALLKVLLTNACRYDCAYCINRSSSGVERARFETDELVGLVLDFYKRNYIEGLFLSSGVVKSPDATMEALVDVVRTLREKHRFNGYIHLKCVPGASEAAIESAGRWADRLSANVELPRQADLDRLAPDKSLTDVHVTMGQIRDKAALAKHEARPGTAAAFAPAGQTTQLVVGASDASDRVILETASTLYAEHQLRRIYYTAYSPIPSTDARLPSRAPPLLREHRLYQADQLLKNYGFGWDELVSKGAPQLRLDVDPKVAWALAHRGRFPLDVRTAEREDLLRVPGLGVTSVERILAARRTRRLTLEDLGKLGAVVRRAEAFLVTADRPAAALALDQERLIERLIAPAARQLSLFDARPEAAS